MEMQMLFNNYLISQMIHILDVQRDVIADQSLSSVSINGRNGEIFQGRTLKTRNIVVKFYLKQEYRPEYLEPSQFQKVIRSLVFYLTSNDAPAQLIFSDASDVYHLAMVETMNLVRTLSIGEGEITFKCFDPFMYSIEETTRHFDGLSMNIINNGTANTFPTFSTTLDSDTTYLTYISKNGVVQIGDPNAVHVNTTPQNRRVHVDQCTSMEKFYKGSSIHLYSDTERYIDDSVTFISDGYAIRTNKSPKGEDGDKVYTGQIYVTNLDEIPRNKYFRTQINFTFSSRPSYKNAGNSPEQMGMIEFYLLDSNNKDITNFSMRDYWSTYEHNIPFWYSGKWDLLWKEDSAMGSIKTKQYAQYFESLDDVPTNANIIYDTEVKKYKVVFKDYGGIPIYSSSSTGSKVLTKMGNGVEYAYKSETSTMYCIYMNTAKTQVGWVEKKHSIKEEDGTHVLVTYEIPIDSSSAGNWNDFTGQLVIERKPHSNGSGSVWTLSLHKYVGTDSSGVNSGVVHSFTKTINDPTNRYSETNNPLAKIGVYIASYNGSEQVCRATLDDIIVNEIAGASVDSFNYIGHKDDVITVDMSEGMVYKNGVEFMEHVDIGSKFFDVSAFTNSEVKIMTDCKNPRTTCKIRKRYL